MAKRELRKQAETLRQQGWSVPAIAAELKVARSTAFEWTKHLPREGNEAAVARRKAHSKAMTDARWSEHRVERDADRAAILESAAAGVGQLSDRELLFIGAAIYWSEGSKAKPWRPNHWPVTFTNSDLGLVRLFLRFLEVVGYHRDELNFRLSIHESADVDVAEQWWISQLGLKADALARTTLKKHNPSPGRHNAGVDYRGCLVVRVPRPTRLYWRIEGIMKGLIGSALNDG